MNIPHLVHPAVTFKQEAHPLLNSGPQKSDITVITVPLVSTAKVPQHKVGVNQVLGKPNLTQHV